MGGVLCPKLVQSKIIRPEDHFLVKDNGEVLCNHLKTQNGSHDVPNKAMYICYNLDVTY